ncbi:AGL178W family transposase [Vanderwaltozyma polyspora DSM 70294]|uniref:AGL178W family transposase n=1 Tax=Vanderwaltozyma polyspora (strain ATCC 22028 / DSM 70294 / BCRC 21397 / CBS 2163 / NBRC 10782 / NRRL Y-8283 / UCD 57-17) TaxID=436907 RepID=A7TGN6_VANPO|nr:AGL178W family transposase [Vanderwaltozyma polyspora DSM 70294]EDO18643.1 AGL178W family transposase [Vanderwaltozyma polyspora DSM 70294]
MSTSTTFHSEEGKETSSTTKRMGRVAAAFYGTHDVLTINSFLSTMRIQFAMQDLPETKRIPFVAIHFEALARSWFEMWSEENMDAPYETFVKAFKKRFEQAANPEKLLSDIEKLKPMEIGIEAFITEFERLHRLLPQGEIPLFITKHLYLRNMDESIATAIDLANPQTLEELYNMTYQHIPRKDRTTYTVNKNETVKSTDDILTTTAAIYRRNHDRNGRTNRGKVGKNHYSLRNERRTKGLCYRCGKADHMYKDCPEGRKTYSDNKGPEKARPHQY